MTYTGRSSGLAAMTDRGRRGVVSRVRRALVSSGRQMPTSEQRGHLGLSTSGGGAVSVAAVRQSRSSRSWMLPMAASVMGTVMRRRGWSYQISAVLTV